MFGPPVVVTVVWREWDGFQSSHLPQFNVGFPTNQNTRLDGTAVGGYGYDSCRAGVREYRGTDSAPQLVRSARANCSSSSDVLLRRHAVFSPSYDSSLRPCHVRGTHELCLLSLDMRGRVWGGRMITHIGCCLLIAHQAVMTLAASPPLRLEQPLPPGSGLFSLLRPGWEWRRILRWYDWSETIWQGAYSSSSRAYGALQVADVAQSRGTAGLLRSVFDSQTSRCRNDSSTLWVETLGTVWTLTFRSDDRDTLQRVS